MIELAKKKLFERKVQLVERKNGRIVKNESYDVTEFVDKVKPHWWTTKQQISENIHWLIDKDKFGRK